MYICKLICRQMLKSIILFFRKRRIIKNLQHKIMLQFPDLQKYPTITILIDDNQKKSVKEMECFVKESFKPKRMRFIIMTNSLQEDLLQSDSMFFIDNKDFNKLGLLKKEKEIILKSLFDEILINLSDNNENFLNDYLVSCINSTFKIGHPKTNMNLHDLIIDYGIEKNDVERLKIIYKYLMMLSGNKNEK